MKLISSSVLVDVCVVEDDVKEKKEGACCV